MNPNPNHHVCVHGHFYQPPRENPWLGVLEEQDSAAPFHDWNERIASECYTALTCSPVADHEGKTRDLFNCYAHMSYNFGPTLLEWMEKNLPGVFQRIALADELARQTYGGGGAAMAQAYNHMILPLADSRDRHTQIIWGLREFEHRYGRAADSIWLSETAIDMNTVRALIDHGIKYVILSPLQASYVRRFGEVAWTGVPDGSIETRHPYRLFEVDGGGRTHFERYLDVFFYDKGLSTKVSFERLLSDAQKLEWFVRQRLDDDANLPQLVLIATDGEIYGHHEKHGNRALAYFFNQLLERKNILLTNLSLYLKENPPCWEVRLWDGIDGKGSSWSCSHGVGRWERDCGCGCGPSEWNQKWRAPLRQAFDELRSHLRDIFRREMGALVYDALEARNDYIRVLLDTGAQARAIFIARHAQRELTPAEAQRLWQLLEMDRNGMLMYTSCGWFFNDVSGIEPVQNMRYALRAAELARDFTETDLVGRLEKQLARAASNLPEQRDGAEVFRRHVLSTCYGFREVAATHALCRLLAIPEPDYAITCTLEDVSIRNAGGYEILAARAVCRDTRILRETELHIVAARNEKDFLGVCVFSAEDEARKAAQKGAKDIADPAAPSAIPLTRIPFAERRRIVETFYRRPIGNSAEELQDVYRKFMPLLEKLCGYGLPLPQTLRVIGEQALTQRLEQVAVRIAEAGSVNEADCESLSCIVREAAAAGLHLDKRGAALILMRALEEKLEDIMTGLSIEDIGQALKMLRLAHEFALALSNLDVLQDRFWRVLHLSPRPTPSSRLIVDKIRELGQELGFDAQVIRKHTQILFSTPV